MTACKHKVSGTISLPSRGSFHLSLTVLLLYRSSGSILAWRVGPPASHRVTRVRRYSGSSPNSFHFRLRGSHTLWPAFPCRSPSKIDLSDCPQPQEYCYSWFGHAPRSLATTSGISVDYFSSSYLDVSVQTVPLIHLLIQCMIPFGGFPHSDISGSLLICSSPKLFAAYRVLHRLLMPRHSPCALSSLT